MVEEILYYCTLGEHLLPASKFSPSRLLRKSKHCRECLAANEIKNKQERKEAGIDDGLRRCRWGKEILELSDMVVGKGNICLPHRREEEAERTREWRWKNGTTPRVIHVIDEQGRECSKCGDYKLWDEFYEDKSAQCKKCWNLTTREGRIKRNYGLSMEEYENLLKIQNYMCGLCQESETKESFQTARPDNLSIDHWHGCENHKARKACKDCIRGLLCASCNISLGHLEHKPKMRHLFEPYLSSRPFV